MRPSCLSCQPATSGLERKLMQPLAMWCVPETRDTGVGRNANIGRSESVGANSRTAAWIVVVSVLDVGTSFWRNSVRGPSSNCWRPDQSMRRRHRAVTGYGPPTVTPTLQERSGGEHRRRRRQTVRRRADTTHGRFLEDRDPWRSLPRFPRGPDQPLAPRTASAPQSRPTLHETSAPGRGSGALSVTDIRPAMR
jgi:hypothetical protein